jgi:hypothetical protein
MAGLLVTSGCGSSHDAAVQDTAESFYQAVAEGDGAGACAALAPRTVSELEQSAEKPCPDAVLEEDIPDPGAASSVAVYGTMAQVRFRDETTFLTRFPDGWRVMATACASKVAAGVYDCQVKGG